MQDGEHGSITAAAACAIGGLLLVVVLIGAAASAFFGGGSSASVACSLPSGGTASVPGLDSAQIGNAATIVGVAAQLRLPAQAAAIAVATAMQESDLENLDYGDRDSLGLFQQRPSQGWGTPAEIMNPQYAAHAFYTRLIAIPGWQQLPLTVAAQDVQHSATPGAYAQWQQLAQAVVTDLTGGQTCTAPAGGDARGIIAAEWALSQTGKPYIWGGTGPDGYDCSGLAMVAWEHAGVPLGRTTYVQWTEGTPVARTQLQPGDLVFFEPTPAGPGHVAIYIGGNDVVQAPETGQDVDVASLSQPWFVSQYVGARRP